MKRTYTDPKKWPRDNHDKHVAAGKLGARRHKGLKTFTRGSIKANFGGSTRHTRTAEQELEARNRETVRRHKEHDAKMAAAREADREIERRKAAEAKAKKDKAAEEKRKDREAVKWYAEHYGAGAKAKAKQAHKLTVWKQGQGQYWSKEYSSKAAALKEMRDTSYDIYKATIDGETYMRGADRWRTWRKQ